MDDFKEQAQALLAWSYVHERRHANSVRYGKKKNWLGV
jgi:hypothetical protein